MKQKVMIICAFIVDPELYIIDEPFLGLDPLGIQSMLDLMVEKKNEGRTVLIVPIFLQLLKDIVIDSLF